MKYFILVTISLLILAGCGGGGGTTQEAGSGQTGPSTGSGPSSEDEVIGSGPSSEDEPVGSGPTADDTNTGSGLVASKDPEHFECPDAQLLSPTHGGKWLAIIKLNDGYCYPAAQFDKSSQPDLCKEVHYHTELRSLSGKKIRSDSDPCGAAVYSDIVKQGGGIYIETEQKSQIETYELGKAFGN